MRLRVAAGAMLFDSAVSKRSQLENSDCRCVGCSVTASAVAACADCFEKSVSASLVWPKCAYVRVGLRIVARVCTS